MKMNKKGTNKILSMYWFAILLIVVGGVVSMVTIFYNSPYDVREIEGNLMINQIVDCISEHENLNSKVFEDFDVLEECNFKEDLFGGDGEYFFNFSIYNFSDSKLVNSFSEGNNKLKADCNIEDEDYEKLSKCIGREVYLVNENDLYKINILSAVKKVKKNVK